MSYINVLYQVSRITNKPVKPLPLGGGYKGAFDFS
jgi:hypothetical protein